MLEILYFGLLIFLVRGLFRLELVLLGDYSIAIDIHQGYKKG